MTAVLPRRAAYAGRHRRVAPVLPRVALAVAAAVMGSCAVSGMSFSDATWSDSSSTGVAVSAADDWTAPSVSMVDPGAVVSGTATVAAVASDDRSSVASVLIEYDAPGLPDVWIPVCTDTTAPFSCAWDTSAVADNSGFRLRATATDAEGLQKVSSTVFTRVKNFYIALAAVPAAVRGTANLSATWHAWGRRASRSSARPTARAGWLAIGCSLRTANPTATCAWEHDELRLAAVVPPRDPELRRHDVHRHPGCGRGRRQRAAHGLPHRPAPGRSSARSS